MQEEIHRLCCGLENIKWTEPENLHITLHFLGEISSFQLDELVFSLHKIKWKSFSLELEGLGIFSEKRNPSPIWIGVRESEDLQKLKKQIDSSLIREHLPINKNFVPHLTLGRWKSYRESNWKEYINLFGNNAHFHFSVETIYLIKSILTPKGSRYEILEEFRGE